MAREPVWFWCSQRLSGALPGVPAWNSGGGPDQVAGTFGRVFNPQIYTHFYLSRYGKLIFHDMLGWNRCCRSVHKTALWCFTRSVWKHRK